MNIPASKHAASKPRKRGLLVDDMMSAAEFLRDVDLKGCEVFGFTGGQFSLMELLVALLDRVGHADLDLST